MRSSALRRPVLCFAFAIAACSTAPSANRAASDASDAGGSADGGGSQTNDAGVDASVLSLGLPPGPFTAPPAVTVPFDDKAMLAVSVAPSFDYDSALLEDPVTGRWVVVFDRFTDELSLDGELRVTWLDDSSTFVPSARLSFQDEPLQAGPRAFVHGGETFLYFMHGSSSNKRAHLARSRFSAGSFEVASDLKLADAFTGMLAWPGPVESGADVVLAYDHYGATNHVARGDGLAFGAPTQVGVGVQGRVGSFASGALAYTFQNGSMTELIAYVRVTTDGVTWTEAKPLTPKVNVHDVSPFRRADGAVDIYYISSDNAPGFRAYRRAVHEDASLGPEQLVSGDSVGGVTQPHPHRLRDGTIGLTFVRQVTSNVDTDSYAVHLKGDAPL
jgi:hypothetical protein